MLQRIIDIICHPSRIGLYHKDKWWVVFIHLVVMIALMAISCTLSAMNTSYFSSEDTKLIYSLVRDADESNLSYIDKRLEGNTLVVTSADFDAVFLGDGTIPKDSSKMTMHFNEEDINIYLGSMLLNNYKYANSYANSFSFKNLQEGVLKDRLAFEELIHGALMSVNSTYLRMDIISGILSFILSYIFVLLIVYAFSYMSKPDISWPIRLRICVYSTLIYFLLLIFRFSFNIRLFEFLAYILPVFYTNIAFSRIIKVKIRRD